MSRKIKRLNKPNMTDVLQEVKRDIFATMNCVQIGIIEEFNPEEQTASIRIALKTIKSILPDGTRELQEKPLLVRCPVMVLFGGVSFINLPIEPGDTCIVLFNDREIDEWFFNGGVQTPQTLRAHDLSDAFALVGIRSLQNSIASYLANGIRLQHSEGTKIDLTAGQISSLADLFLHVGNMQVDGNVVINGNLLVNGTITSDDGTVIVYNTHQHGNVTNGGGTSGGPI